MHYLDDGPAMAGYTDQIKKALWHSKECVKSLRRAADAIGCDIDEPLQESGLIPPVPDDDIDFPDHVEPTAPLDPDLENPQSRARALRLVRAFASYR
jgi:hypothetical protein